MLHPTGFTIKFLGKIKNKNIPLYTDAQSSRETQNLGGKTALSFSPLFSGVLSPLTNPDTF
jgi:hypothetical protein